MIPYLEVVIFLIPDSKRVLKHLKSEQELGLIRRQGQIQYSETFLGNYSNTPIEHGSDSTSTD